MIAALAVLIDAPRHTAGPPGPEPSGISVPPSPVVAAGRSVLLINQGGAAGRSLLDRVAADMGAAVDAVVGFWGSDWSREITVVASGSQTQFAAEAGGGDAAQWADIAAIAVADRVDPARRTVLGQRIVFAPAAATMSEQSLRIVLTHELFHYAARVDTAVDAPRWLTEGVADFVARPQTTRPAPLPPPTALPSDSDLAAPGPQRSLGYDRAWWFARFVADTYGPVTLRRLYQAACAVGHADVATAVRDVLGLDTAELVARWQHWTGR